MAGEFGMAGDPYGPTAGTPASVGASGGGLSSLLRNKMFLQFLMGAGQDISQGTGGTNLGAAVQRNIQSQNMIKLLKHLLGPDSSKATIDKSGLKISTGTDSALLKSFLGGDQDPFGAITGPKAGSMKNGAAYSVDPIAASAGYTPASASANPFGNGQPNMNISASDLAGLTTQDISTALGMKMKSDELKQQSYRDMVDALYKGSTMQRAAEAAEAEIPYKKQLTKQSEAVTLENTPSVNINVGGITMKVTPKDALAWERLKKEITPKEVQEYKFALTEEGGGFKGSIVDYKNSSLPADVKAYKYAVDNGMSKIGLKQWKEDIARASAPTIPGAVERQEALEKVKRQSEVQDPGLAQKILQSLMKDRMNWNDPPKLAKTMKENPQFTREQIIDALHREMHREAMNIQIKQAYPDAKFVMHKGWIVDNKIIVRDPYAK